MVFNVKIQPYSSRRRQKKRREEKKKVKKLEIKAEYIQVYLEIIHVII